jgi:hypothetical protein
MLGDSFVGGPDLQFFLRGLKEKYVEQRPLVIGPVIIEAIGQDIELGAVKLMKMIIEVQEPLAKFLEDLKDFGAIGSHCDCIFNGIELMRQRLKITFWIQDLIHDIGDMVLIDLKGGLVLNGIHEGIPVLVDIYDQARYVFICIIIDRLWHLGKFGCCFF